MATFVPTPAAKILIRGQNQGRNWSHSVWAGDTLLPTAPTVGQLATLAGAVASALTGNPFLAFLGNAINILAVEARNAQVERQPGSIVAVDLAGTGGASAPQAIGAKVFIVPNPSSGFRRPSVTTLPGVPIANLGESTQPNVLNSTYITAAEAYMQSLHDAIAAAIANWDLVAVSQQFAGLPRTAGIIAPFQAFNVRPLVATQDRRQRRIGRKESAEALAARAERAAIRAQLSLQNRQVVRMGTQLWVPTQRPIAATLAGTAPIEAVS